jgi:hypothetical protein
MDISVLDYSRVSTDPARALIREWSHLPDLSVARPGDLILTSPQPAAGKAKLIRVAQSTHLKHEWINSLWTHAAIYTGVEYRIVEATPEKGVSESDLRDYLGKYLIRFRRVHFFSPEQRQKIVEFARSKVGNEDYNRGKIAACAYKGTRWDVWNLPGVSAGHICSSLFTDIVDSVHGKRTLFRSLKQPPVPALLSQSSYLVDVPIGWRATESLPS